MEYECKNCRNFNTNSELCGNCLSVNDRPDFKPTEWRCREMEIRINRKPVDKRKAVSAVLNKMFECVDKTVNDYGINTSPSGFWCSVIDEVYNNKEDGEIESIEFPERWIKVIQFVRDKISIEFKDSEDIWQCRQFSKNELNQFIETLQLIERQMA